MVDAQVRRVVYDWFIQSGQPISRSEIAAELSLAQADAGAALDRLAAARVLVLQPESGQILMANPFSAVPTSFRVVSGTKFWWGNCIWDALGVLAMTGED